MPQPITGIYKITSNYGLHSLLGHIFFIQKTF